MEGASDSLATLLQPTGRSWTARYTTGRAWHNWVADRPPGRHEPTQASTLSVSSRLTSRKRSPAGLSSPPLTARPSEGRLRRG
eukprot:7260405-Alexandrium_andersonii.AAC.1